METIFRTGKKESFDRQMKNRGQCLATFSSRSQLIDGSEQSIIQPTNQCLLSTLKDIRICTNILN